MWFSRIVWLVLFVTAVQISTATAATYSATTTRQPEAVMYAQQMSKQLSTQEWLGPIAAVAISPFFGLACLSGIATYGPEWLQQKSAFLSSDSPMNNPFLFWGMSVVTVITSLPRFTKISKPLSLLTEKLELYSAIIILVILKFAATASIQSPASVDVALNSGFFSVSNDVMFAIAAAVNLIVINTIKLVIEFLVWLIPIPFVDSALEIFNKSLCAGFAALYAYSPLLASLVNLLLFVVCAFLFLRVTRYLSYLKTLYIWPTVRSAMGIDESKEVIFPGFTLHKWKGIPSRSELQLEKKDGGRIGILYSTWLTTHALGTATIQSASSGILADRYVLSVGGDEVSVDVRKGTIAKDPLHSQVNSATTGAT
ncbi:MAG: hypothetical protein LW870_08030 [Pirellula sp.]|jgi:hypothetical protein|nr:hypothetical protein [Pirellula sp.]